MQTTSLLRALSVLGETRLLPANVVTDLHAAYVYLRRLENRLRVRFLAKIPRLTDRYFQSRPISDMAERSHNVHQLRQGPELAATFLRNLFGMALTVAAIGWLYPGSLWSAVGKSGCAHERSVEASLASVGVKSR